MGRQQITEHIEAELSGRSTEATEPQETTDVLCQYCGIGIETEGQRPDDYVVHSIPSHGESGRNFVLYCSPACFQEAMGELLDV
jgi:hypothetical protein